MYIYCQGFIQREGGLESPPSSPEILKLSMVIIALSQVLNNNLVPDFVRSNLRGSKFKIFLGGVGMPPDSPSRHTCISHATMILLPSCSQPPPPQIKILLETKTIVPKREPTLEKVPNPYFLTSCVGSKFTLMSIHLWTDLRVTNRAHSVLFMRPT